MGNTTRQTNNGNNTIKKEKAESRNIYAAIDIGSNAIRLLVSNVEQYPNETLYKKLAYIRVPLRLGEDVFTQGFISEKKQEQFIEAMKGFLHLMNAYGVKAYRACATSAMREASNGKELIEATAEKAGVSIDLINGKEEAEIIFRGGMSETMDPNKSYLYLDVGGGSSEFSVYCNHRRTESCSFKVGTVRWIKEAVEPEELKKMKKWLKNNCKQYMPTVLIGTGGNINKAKGLLGKKENETITYTELKILYDYIRSFSYEERIHILQLNPSRADVIVPALKIFLMTMKSCKINELIIPKSGLSDGIIRELSYR